MKKQFKKIISVSIFSFFMLFFASTVLAAVSYTPLEPGAFTSITNSTSGAIDFNNLGAFFGQIFNYGIAVAGVLAVVMIIWGGIEYMTTDSWTGKDDGKKRIQDALVGLGLALVSWLVLYTINPCLVNFGSCNNKFLAPGAKTSLNITINKNV